MIRFTLLTGLLNRSRSISLAFCLVYAIRLLLMTRWNLYIWYIHLYTEILFTFYSLILSFNRSRYVHLRSSSHSYLVFWTGVEVHPLIIFQDLFSCSCKILPKIYTSNRFIQFTHFPDFWNTRGGLSIAFLHRIGFLFHSKVFAFSFTLSSQLAS